MAYQHTPPSSARAHASEGLCRAFQGCRVINQEGSVLDLPLEMQGKKTAIRISLPPYFPHDPPSLMMVIPVQHPRVDPQSGRVKLPSLENWSVSQGRCDINAVVQEALGVLLGGAPQPQEIEDTDEDIRVRATSALEALPVSELERLLNDDEAYKEFMVQFVKESTAAKNLAQIERQNVSLAQEVISLQQSIDEARNQVAIVRSSEYATCKGELEGLLQRQEAVLAKMGPSTILDKLRQQADAVDEASSKLADDFCTGSVPLEQYVDQYTQKRIDYHVLDLKRQAADVGI